MGTAKEDNLPHDGHEQPAPIGRPTLMRRIRRRMRRRGADAVLQDVAAIRASGRFDTAWYLEEYPDVTASGMDPVEHYVRHGAAEGRNPSADFDTWYYLKENPDVTWAGLNPFRHYVEHGFAEGRPALPPARRKITDGPLVSLIIPVYEVEEYLAECLDSVVGQNYRNLEIIIVDDGSPDASYDIASAYAQIDPRIKILRRENGGLGAARNTGVAAATGRYLGFMDSDDTLPPDAVARMVASLQRSGSDFAVGSIRRMRNRKPMPPDGWVKEVHAEDRMHIRLADFPEILTDVFACNKLFDSSFFRQKVGPFPEKIRYEDQEPTAKAYLCGEFDVLAGTVYYWRIRDDGTSITQKKSDPDDLRDRLIVKQRVSRILAEADTSAYGTWLAKAIGFDLRPYFEQVPRTDVGFFDRLREGMLPLARQMTPQLWQKVRMIDRLPALAVLAGNRDDVGVAVTRRGEYGYFVPSRIEDGAAYLDRKYLEGMRLAPDDELLRLADADLSVVACATSLWWHGGLLHLEGFAYLTNVEFDDDTWISARFVSAGRPPVELDLRRREVPRVDFESTDAWNGHARSGFAAAIDPTQLRLDSDAAWRMEITVGHSRLNYSRRTILREADVRGIRAAPVVSAICGKSRWIAAFEPGVGLVVQCRSSAGALVSAIDTKGEWVEIAIESSAAETLLLINEILHVRMEVPGTRSEGNRAVFRFRLPALDDNDNREHSWHVRVCGQDAPQALIYPGDVDDLDRACPEHHRVRPVMGRSGALRLSQSGWWAVADTADVGPDAITIQGRIDAPEASALSARLVGDTQVLEAELVDLDTTAQRFEVRIPFDPGITTAIGQVLSPRQRSPLAGSDDGPATATSDLIQPRESLQPTMLHGFSLRLSITRQGRTSERWLRVANGLQRQLPEDHRASRYGLTLTRTSGAAALWVRFRQPYQDDERGRLAQRRLHASLAHFGKAAEQGMAPRLQNAILFESFGGEQVADSVLALCNEIIRRQMKFDLYWTVADLSMPVPRGTTPLLIHSREWVKTLHHARYLVNNNNFPFYFRKSRGQTYLQTWHGTPLKRIGKDVPQANLSLPYRQLMQRESGYWDYLVAQNDYAAGILPSAFGYSGPVVNLGYPRNDALAGPGADLRRLVARNRFGFEPFHFVVLYAPTWRDNLSGPRGYSQVNYLDFGCVRKILGRNARVIFRGHQNTSRNVATREPGVVDATRYPDINDLLLAADLLITDYSSVMFDYIVTGKPIVFLVPDLEEYRDTTRGFYVGLEEVAPGPLCRSNEQLAEVLSHLGESMEASYVRYRAFARRFTSQDDGSASVRVVDAVWGREPALGQS